MAAEEQRTNQFRIEVDGSPLAADVAAELAEATIETSLNLPDLFVLTFRDQGRDLLARGGFRVGVGVVIRVFSDDHIGGEKLVDGEVTAVELELESSGTFTVIRGFDRTHRLHRRRVTTSHVDMSYSDIARTLATAAGLSIGTIQSTGQVHQHVAQVNTTDWGLLNRLAAEVGFTVGVTDGKFHFRRPVDASTGPRSGTATSTNPFQLSVGVNLLRCRATVTAADQVDEVEVRGWNPETKKPLTGRQPAATTSADNGATPHGLAAAFTSPRRVSVDVPYSTQSEVDAAATALSEAVASCFAELEGVARGDPRLRAGVTIGLGLAKEPFDGKYVLSTTRHTWTPSEGYLVSFSASGGRDRSIHGLISGSGEDVSRAGLVPGVAIAVVTDVRDPEGRLRVKLALPWLAEHYESDWARTSHAGAGADRGWLILPEVGDEVLVSFQQGDIRRPFVIGGLYNGVDEPVPSATERLVDRTAGSVNRRTFVSRVGHRLVFVDEQGKEAIELTTSDDNHSIVLDQVGAAVRVTSGGEVVVESARDISVTSSGGDVKLSGRKVSITASAGLSLDGGPETVVTGGTVKIN